jgi:hypothetical protein
MTGCLGQGARSGAFPRRSSIFDKKSGRLVELKPLLGLGWVEHRQCAGHVGCLYISKYFRTGC